MLAGYQASDGDLANLVCCPALQSRVVYSRGSPPVQLGPGLMAVQRSLDVWRFQWRRKNNFAVASCIQHSITTSAARPWSYGGYRLQICIRLEILVEKKKQNITEVKPFSNLGSFFNPKLVPIWKFYHGALEVTSSITDLLINNIISSVTSAH